MTDPARPTGQIPAAPPREPRLVRQGDVLVASTPSIPIDAVAIARDRGRIILAHGEATGHAHAIRSAAADLLGVGDERYLRATEPIVIEHEEHAPIDLPAGEYRVVIQREYVPDPVRSRAWRQAVD